MKKIISLIIFNLLQLTTFTAFGLPDLKELNQMMAKFAPVEIKADVLRLPPSEKEALRKLIKAARILDDLFLTQYWSQNKAVRAGLTKDKSTLGRTRLQLFDIYMAPWSALDDHAAFVPDVPAKHHPGANFYPEDMTKSEFESWVSKLSKDEQTQAKGFFSVIRRDTDGKLKLIPYSQEYNTELKKVAELLKAAASDTKNVSLRKFLNLRAEALLNDNYYASDVAWMDLDSPLDITFGPYETYNDEHFGYKAAFEAFITLRDDAETAKLSFFSSRLQEVENNLPIDPQYRNPKLGAMAPIRVVNQILASGDANRGVRTAAFNLPNDEVVVSEKGSKRVMLKNVQEAKFRRILSPIAKNTLNSKSQKDVNFDSFFTHILAHELSHGIGPHKIKVNGKESNPRQELKELYSAIEEAKADITGLYMLQYLFDHNQGSKLKGGEAAERKLYTTFLASAFRTLRFGIAESHGKGMALQLNYILGKGGFTVNPNDGTFDVDFSKIKGAVRDLTHDLMTIQATGNYTAAKKLMAEKAVMRPELQKVLDKLKSIPVDIKPISITADALVPKSIKN